MPDAAARFDAVLFDLDGVLVDSEPRWNDVRIAYAGARGLAWTHDDQRACMGGNSRQWAEIMRERLGLADEPVERIEADVIEGLVDAYRHGGVEVIAGAPEAVSRIAARWQVAIASSSPPRVIAAAVDALGLHGVFGALTSSDEVPHGKPEPDVYLLAARRFSVAPHRCIVVEDSVNGVLAGKAAGAYAVLIPNPSVLPPAEAFDAADAVVASLADLRPDALPA